MLESRSVRLHVITKCYVVESLIRTLKKAITRFIESERRPRYLEFVQRYVSWRNSSKPRGHTRTRLEAASERPGEHIDEREAVPFHQPKLSVGNVVRLLVRRDLFKKESHTGNWSRKLYMITYINPTQPKPLYELHEMESGRKHRRSVNEAELMLVEK